MESPGPRITMAEAKERKGQIEKAFKEMQSAYVSAMTTSPPDPETNLWANERIRVLEWTISRSILFLQQGDAWTEEEEAAVDELNRYVAMVGEALEISYPLFRNEEGRTPDSALAQSPIAKAPPPPH